MGSTLRRYRIQIVVQFHSGFYEYDPQILMYPQPVINLTSLLAVQLHDIGWWPVSFTCWCMTAFKTRLVRYKEGAGNRSEHWHSSVDSDSQVSVYLWCVNSFDSSQGPKTLSASFSCSSFATAVHLLRYDVSHAVPLLSRFYLCCLISSRGSLSTMQKSFQVHWVSVHHLAKYRFLTSSSRIDCKWLTNGSSHL